MAIVRIITDLEEARGTVLRRLPLEEVQTPPSVAQRLHDLFGRELSAAEAVASIIADIRQGGDDALRAWTSKLDHVELDQLEVSRQTIKSAYDAIPRSLVEALELASERIAEFHRRHIPRSWVDFTARGTLGQLVLPLERVGVYAPGGRAAYPSSILMQVVPAKVAGVDDVIVASPPTASGLPVAITLVACDIAKVDRVFAVGGAQAIAAMAYGTDSVPRVDKIMGPGNIFVALAKRQVFGTVAIDQIAGPTETVIIADDTAKPECVAVDMLAQAEHDPLASAIVFTTSQELAAEVVNAVEKLLVNLPTGKVAAESLARNGAIIVVEDVETAIELANAYASEHLCLQTSNPWQWLPYVRHSGGVFLGEDTPEAMGDYIAGPSHVMPTGGTARFFSTLNTADFVKVSSLVALSRGNLEELGPPAAAIAEAEGLAAHAEAIKLRLRATGEEGK